MTTLAGQTILIVGGSSGIGFGVAKVALLDSASLVIIASSSQSKVNDAINRLTTQLQSSIGASELEKRLKGEVVDASKLVEVTKLVERVGEIDHLVWTSGEGLRLDFPKYNLDEHKDLFDIRFWGPLEASKSAKIKAGGSIVLTVGQVIKKPSKGWTLMAGMMGAVEAATRGLAVDLAPLRVNVVSPGAVKTELWDGIVPSDAEKEKMYAAIGQKLLVGHIAEPEEVAEAYTFLMKCKYITGQCIAVDGGATLAP